MCRWDLAYHLRNVTRVAYSVTGFLTKVVPKCHDDSAFAAGLAVFVDGPFTAGIFAKVAPLAMLPIASLLLLLCPVVDVVTDSIFPNLIAMVTGTGKWWG